jgi:hypothetical protein
MHFTALDYLSLAAQLPFELIGAWLCIRNRKPWPLTALLMFAAFFDLSCLICSGNKLAYCYAYWWQQAAGYVFQGILTAYACGELVSAHKRDARLVAGIMGLGIGAAVTWHYCSETMLYERLLSAEMAVDSILLGILAVGVIGHFEGFRKLPQTWFWIVASLGLLLWSDVTVSAAGLAREWYYPAQAMSVWLFLGAAMKPEPGAVRQSLGVVCEPTEVITNVQ